MAAVTSFSSEKMYLWNPTSIGEPIILGNSQDRLIKVNCSERSLRLAHKHVVQSSNNNFHGFLLGSIELNEDGTEILINLDRFDPGSTAENEEKFPCVAFPGDVVVPFKLVKSTLSGLHSSNESKEHMYSAIQMVKNAVNSRSAIDLSKILAISLHCVYSGGKNSDDSSINIQFYWNAVFISTTLEISLVKNVPIIPTALAKTLANSVDFIQEDTIKTGIMTMDKTRKLMLMLDSDPKISTVAAVGVWISYVSSVYHPAVWLTCLRFLLHSFYKKVFSEQNEFLLVVYAVPNSRPSFYKCSADQFERLSFDVVTAEHTFALKNQPYQTSRMMNVTLDYSPSMEDQCRVAFDRALREHYSKNRSTSSTKEYTLEQKNEPITTSFQRDAKPNGSSPKNNADYKPSPSPAPQINPNYKPSPAPKPITRSIPILPSVLEPSMIMNESSNVAAIADQVTSGTPIYSYQRDLDDDLVPSFYGESHVLEAVPRSSAPTSNHGPQQNIFDSDPNSKIRPPPAQKKTHTHSIRPPSKPLKGHHRSTNHSHRAEASSDVHLSQQSWFKSLPLVARKFYLVQEQRHKALIDQFTRYRNEVESRRSSDRRDVAVQVDDDCRRSVQTVGVNTDDALLSDHSQMNSLCQTDVFSNESDVVSEVKSLPDEQAMRNIDSTSTAVTPVSSPSKVDNLDLDASEATNRGDSEFSSIQLNSSALNTSNNNPSIVSSLKAVDLPGLDSTTDNTSTPCALDLFSQNSPILGESASMYLAAKHRHPAKDRLVTEDDEDQEFFGNLLKQVQEMLGKGDEEAVDESSFLPDYTLRTLKYDRSFPTPIVPHLTNLGVMSHRAALDNFDLSALLGSGSGHELSMHANAIAMKYLSDEQLASIAANSSDDRTSPAVGLKLNDVSCSNEVDICSGSKPASGYSPHNDMILPQSISSTSLPSSDQHTGLSLLSPANMSLATKKYMKKYGLVALEEESDEEDNDKENVLPSEPKEESFSRSENVPSKHNQVVLSSSNEKKSTDNVPGSRHDDDDDRRLCSVDGRRDQADESLDRDGDSLSNCTETAGWSHLKDNLGETFDMLLPFLSDLEKNQQSEDHMNRERSHDKGVNSGSGETVEQILSPRILKTIKRANKKFERNNRNENPSVASEPDSKQGSLKRNSSKKAYSYSQESHITVPDTPSLHPCSGKARSVDLSCSRERACSVDRMLHHKRFESTGNHRRSHSRECSNKHKSRKIPSYERVLDSQIMQAFNKDLPDVTDGTRISTSVEEEEENILNIQRIKSLQKLS